MRLFKINKEKEYMHHFLKFWVQFKSKDFLESEWYEIMCCEWCAYFGYYDPDLDLDADNDLIDFSIESIKEFKIIITKNKPESFFNKDWENFLKAYDVYFDAFLRPE